MHETWCGFSPKVRDFNSALSNVKPSILNAEDNTEAVLGFLLCLLTSAGLEYLGQEG